MTFQLKDLLVVVVPTVKKSKITKHHATAVVCGKCTRSTARGGVPTPCGACSRYTCVKACGVCTNCTNCTNGTTCGACTGCTECTHVTGRSECVPHSGDADACAGTLSYDAKLKVLVLELRKKKG